MFVCNRVYNLVKIGIWDKKTISINNILIFVYLFNSSAISTFCLNNLYVYKIKKAI